MNHAEHFSGSPAAPKPEAMHAAAWEDVTREQALEQTEHRLALIEQRIAELEHPSTSQRLRSLFPGRQAHLQDELSTLYHERTDLTQQRDRLLHPVDPTLH